MRTQAPVLDLDADPAAKDDAESIAYAEHFAPRVRGAAIRVLRRYGLADVHRDDLVSAGYLGLWKALQNRRADAHEYELSAYVSRRIEGAVLDEARQVLSRGSRQASVDPVTLEAEPLRDADSDAASGSSTPARPEDCADRSLRWELVEHCLARLDEDARALVLGLAEGSSLAEMAREQGDSAGRLQTRLGRAARQLRARAPELRRILRAEV